MHWLSKLARGGRRRCRNDRASGRKGQAAGTSIWEQDTLTGDWGGARTALEGQAASTSRSTTSARPSRVLSGGIDRRASYEGRLEFSVDTDLEKLIGWKGATTHVNVYQIHNSGHNVVDNVGSIADPSNIDALPTTRLFTAWFEQKLSTTGSRCASASSRPTTNSSPARPSAVRTPETARRLDQRHLRLGRHSRPPI